MARSAYNCMLHATNTIYTFLILSWFGTESGCARHLVKYIHIMVFRRVYYILYFMNYGKITYNVGHCTCNSNKPKNCYALRIENAVASSSQPPANGTRKCRPDKRKPLWHSTANELKFLLIIVKSFHRWWDAVVVVWVVLQYLPPFAPFPRPCQRGVAVRGWSVGGHGSDGWLYFINPSPVGNWKY